MAKITVTSFKPINYTKVYGVEELPKETISVDINILNPHIILMILEDETHNGSDIVDIGIDSTVNVHDIYYQRKDGKYNIIELYL